jgi:putative FmdB family regulatory protein
MPIYEYRCSDCGNEMEVMQRITEEPLRVCPKCNGALCRLISNTGFILKGSGWYVTDYARKDSHKRGERGDTSEKGGDSGGKSTSSKAKEE